jgi:hypothetical protein
MTFSLKSSFSFAEKRVLLIAADKAVLYQRRNGQLSNVYEFLADEHGRENFRRCLDETEPAPIFVLIDIVEEEYRQDVIPHVFGADRKSVLERKFSRLFRGTNYCYALNQGRETDGRKDDKVLLTAITKPDVMRPWLELIQEQRVPLAGIYSLPVLSQRLLKRIGAKGPNTLLISVQNASGLRQTFFRDRNIKISRLAQMPRIGSVPYASHIMGELEKLRRYLNSLGLISSEGPLDIYILSYGEWLNELEHHCRDTDDERYFLLDVADVAVRLGLKKKLNSAYSDALYSQLLMDENPKNHYANKQETKYFSLHQLRNGLVMASGLLLLCSMGWSAFNFLDGVSLKQQAIDAEQKANFYQERYGIARQDLPPTPVDPRNIQTAVNIAESLRHHKADPSPLLEIVSKALEASPSVQLDQITWYAAVDPNSDGENTKRRKGQVVIPEIKRNTKYSHYHIAVFTGHLATFSGDFRSAIAQADEVVKGISEYPDVHFVQVVKYPLDVTSAVDLSGMANLETEQTQAMFSVKVILGISDGTNQS